MGLFDAIAGQVLGSMASSGGNDSSGLMGAIGGLINNPQTGGLPGLVKAFEGQGLGNIVGSWIGTGQNLPISGEQLASVLGNGQIQSIAQQLGLSPEAVSGQLSQLLPQVIDKLSPTGALPEGDGLSQALGMLGSLMR